MPLTATLSQRIFTAHLELNHQVGRKVTLAELGEMIARQMGRQTPFTAAAVSRWESGQQVPAPEVIEAIGAITRVDPGWISHGARSAAPPPRADVSGEYARFDPALGPAGRLRPATPPRGLRKFEP